MYKYSILLLLTFSTFSFNVNANDTFIEKAAVEYSKSYNVTIQEATYRLKIMADQEEIIRLIKGKFGDDIAGIYFDNEGNEFKLVVRTSKKGRLEKDVLALSNQLSARYKLPIDVVANSPRNFKSIENILQNQSSRLMRSIEGIQGLGYNPRKDIISIYVYEPDESKKQSWLNNQQLSKLSGMETEIVFDDGPVKTTSLIGGGFLETSPVSSSYPNKPMCTAGFPATKNGVAGVIAAAHCGTLNKELGTKSRYVGRNNEIHQLTLTGYDTNPDSGKYHDLAFFETNDKTVKALPYYYPDISSYTEEAYPYRSAQVGTYLCHYGRTTGTSCGNVIDVAYANFNNSASGGANKGCASSLPCGNTFVRIERKGLNCLVGDSGGPVYGSVPYGIASSCVVSNSGNAALMYSPLRFVHYTGAQLLTTPY